MTAKELTRMELSDEALDMVAGGSKEGWKKAIKTVVAVKAIVSGGVITYFSGGTLAPVGTVCVAGGMKILKDTYSK